MAKKKHLRRSVFSWLALADTLRTVSAGYDEREVDKIKEVLATA